MKKILLQVPSIHFSKDRFFEAVGRNNLNEPWRILRDNLRSLGYDLTTADDNSLDGCAWIFYFDTLSFDGVYIQRGGIRAKIRALFGIKTPRLWPSRPLYQEAVNAGLQDKIVLILGEGKAVTPENYNPEIWDKFNYIFTSLYSCNMITQQVISVTDLRTKTAQILDSLRGMKYIFVNNKPKSVIMDIKYYEAFQKEMKQDALLAEIARAEKHGKRFSKVETLMKDLLA